MEKTLYLKNIGKLSEAEIKLEGITVICGENNTGKSTIGKALYNIYDVFADCENMVEFQRKEIISREFTKLHNDFHLILESLKDIDGDLIIFNNSIKNRYSIQLFKCNENEINKVLEDYADECIHVYDISKQLLNNEKNKYLNWKNRAVKIISDIKEIPDKEIIKDIVTLRTEKIFHGQATKISKTESSIELKDDMRGSLKTQFVSGDKCDEIYREYTVTKSDLPVYIENPRIIDFLSDRLIKDNIFLRNILSPESGVAEFYARMINENRMHSLDEMQSNPDSRIDVIKTRKKISNMLNELNALLNGSFETSNNSIKFKDKNIPESLDVRNLSTGVKSMAVIERCLSLGLIKEGSTLILDEPEIHLHPEWQLKYAEYIVILQKALDLTVLITTHSPQFLRAIEVYTDKYEIMDRLNVYSIEDDKIKNASYSEYGISEIYEKLSAPYDELQKMLDEKYGEDDE